MDSRAKAIASVAAAAALAVGGFTALKLSASVSTGTGQDGGAAPFDPYGKVTFPLAGPHQTAALKAQSGEAQIADVQAQDGTRLILRRLSDGGIQVIGGAVTASTFCIGTLVDGGAGLQDVLKDRSDGGAAAVGPIP